MVRTSQLIISSSASKAQLLKALTDGRYGRVTAGALHSFQDLWIGGRKDEGTKACVWVLREIFLFPLILAASGLVLRTVPARCQHIQKAGPRGSRAGPFCNDFTFCPVLEGCGTHPARVPCSSKKSCCLRGAGHAGRCSQ